MFLVSRSRFELEGVTLLGGCAPEMPVDLHRQTGTTKKIITTRQLPKYSRSQPRTLFVKIKLQFTSFHKKTKESSQCHGQQPHDPNTGEKNKMPPQGRPYQCPFRYSHDSPTSITYINCTQETKLSWQLPSSACSSALNLHATRPFAKEFTLHGSRLFLIGHGTDIWGPAVTWLSAWSGRGCMQWCPVYMKRIDCFGGH